MKKRLWIGYLLVCILIFTEACGSSQQNGNTTDQGDDNSSEVTQPPETDEPPPPSEDRCGLFEDMDLEAVLYDVYSDSDILTMYVGGWGVIPGLEDGHNGDNWEYTAKLGDSEGFCFNYEEDEQVAGRLFCAIPLPSGYKNAARPFELWLNGCEEPIFSIPLLSVLVTEEEKPKKAGCGEPPAYSCSEEYKAYCNCLGELYFCWTYGPICFPIWVLYP